MIVARVCRALAAVIAFAAIADPRVDLPARHRPGVRVAVDDEAARSSLTERLHAAGFPAVADGEVATVATIDGRAPTAPGTPLFVAAPHDRDPDVAIAGASVSRTRVAGQSVAVAAALRGRHVAGLTSEVQLEDAGLVVASATHRWANEDETWRPALSYLPAGITASRLRLHVVPLPGERQTGGHDLDLLAPPLRGPIRVLAYDPAVTWPATFLRRALEDQPGFVVSTLARATTNAAVRAGTPPSTLRRAELAPFEVLLCGSPERLDASAREAIEWFVERRGGLVILAPDRAPVREMDLLPGVTFAARLLEAPVALAGAAGALNASELALPRTLPSLATPLAVDASRAPVVFVARRGLGAVVFSGALDAWRYRDRSDGAFARFWATTVLAQAAAVPPILEVTADRSVARAGDIVGVTARLRPTELPSGDGRIEAPPVTARAIDATRRSVPIRLWPTAEPGVYAGEWRPAADGAFAIDVTIGTANAATVVQIAADAGRAPRHAEALALAARASGGGVFDDEDALVQALGARFPAVATWTPSHPARSPWWAVAFAGLLCGEWAVRRRRGQP